jgi:SAM-dependent methyltransferase
MDWNVGRYEHTAAQLHPVSQVVVEAIAPRTGEHVLDLGCGTGNATFVMEGYGARATGVDPSWRLLEVARMEATTRGLGADFVFGEAAALPFPDASVDAIVSVFGVIFAPDASAAVAEMTRVLVPRGRLALSAWKPEGPIAAQARIRRDALAAALGEPPGPPPFAWHDRDAVSELLGAYGFSVDLEERSLAFTADSVADFVEEERQNHPMWVEARPVLERHGTWQAVGDDVMELFTAANEDPPAFRISSPYVVVTATRRGKTRASS